ncbi:MAG TPA: tetratricopeptide repeat protein, partial [Pseudoxanthomonas sp.]|nr:tetratricopeptide repeat protein [Pseudoxanthomonas sp.]
ALHFVRPEWLWALLAVPALWMLWRARQRHSSVWQKAVDPHLLPHLLEAGGRTARGAAWLGALGYALAVLALAGPSWRQAEQPLWQSKAPLVVALDLSRAANATDLPPSRLLQARAKLATLLRERQGGQVALVAYAGEAFTVAPLTDDAANVALFLDALEPEVMPVDGQNPGQAIDASVRLMRQAGFDEGDILVVGDHAGAADLRAAAAALAQGFRVSALGLGTAAGAPYRDRSGAIVRARLDAPSLLALTRAGGGSYRSLARDASDLRALGVLEAEPEAAGSGATRGEKALAWQDEGFWLLPPLMLIALLAFRRGGALAAVLLCAMLPLAAPAPAHAAERGWWQRADQKEHARIERGADAYRQGDFDAAAEAFSGIDSATGHYNRANALAKQGRLDEAIEAYDRALQRQPGMEDAIENRRIVDAARKRRQSGGDGQRQGQQGQQSQPQQPPSRGNGGAHPPPKPPTADQRAGQPPADRGKQDQQPQRPPTQPPGSPADAASQAAADAAQRERMEQAMSRARPPAGQGQDGAKGAAVAETAEQRERRQAVEAWLRRVPDDPGGLLKAKFRLEHERRQREGK